MEQYLRFVGKIFVAVGTTDPIINTMGGLNLRLGRQIKPYARQYPPPSRVINIPIAILYCLGVTAKVGTPRQQAIVDLAWISFFFLLQPGEYLQGVSDPVSTPFLI